MGFHDPNLGKVGVLPPPEFARAASRRHSLRILPSRHRSTPANAGFGSTTGDCVTIYDRTFSALSGAPPVALLQATLLPAEFTRLGVTVRRKRGYATP